MFHDGALHQRLQLILQDEAVNDKRKSIVSLQMKNKMKKQRILKTLISELYIFMLYSSVFIFSLFSALSVQYIPL